MPTFREQVANLIGGDARTREIERFQAEAREAVQALVETRRYVMSPESMLRSLGEMDNRLIDLLLAQRGNLRLIPTADRAQMWGENDRLAAVADSRWMYHFDVMVWRAVQMWTDFGFGQHVGVTPADEALTETWEEFWTARRNRPVIGQRKVHTLSSTLLVDGEFFLVFYVSTLDGTCTIRRLSTDRIAEIKTDRDDPDVKLYYVQHTANGQVWYPDWQATEAQLETIPLPDGARRADEMRDNTHVVAMHVALEEENGRGWPQLWRALDWARAYKDFLQNRASVAAAVAMYVDKLKVKGNQRAVDNVIDRLQSHFARAADAGLDRNPTPPAGSAWVENEALSRERMPLTTGAGDAQTDGMTIAAQFASGAGIPLHYLNRSDAMQNRAVAKESSRPWYEQIQRYQAFWVDVLADVVEVVGRMAAEYGKHKGDDFSAEIVLDSPFDNDIGEIVSALDAVSSATSAGVLPAEIGERATVELARELLSALGVRNVDGVLYPEDEAVPDDEPPADGAPQYTGGDAMDAAIENLRAGKINTVQFLAFALAEVASRNGHHAH